MLGEELSDSGETSKDQNVNRVANSEHCVHEASDGIDDSCGSEKRLFMLDAGLHLVFITRPC